MKGLFCVLEAVDSSTPSWPGFVPHFDLCVLGNQTSLTDAVFCPWYIMHHLILVLHLQGQHHQTTRRIRNIKDCLHWGTNDMGFVCCSMVVYTHLNFVCLCVRQHTNVHTQHKHYWAAFVRKVANIKTEDERGLMHTIVQEKLKCNDIHVRDVMGWVSKPFC